MTPSSTGGLSPVLAATPQGKIGFAVVTILVVGWVVYLVSASRRTYVPGADLTEAPNRKAYYTDDGLEGRRLTKYLWWAFATLAISAVGLPIYWVREPFRQQGSGFDRGTKYFDEEAIARGRRYFQASPGDPPTPREPHYGCENCHGVKGVGGVAQYTFSDPANPDAPPKTVQWTAPALNTVMLRFRPDEVRFVLTYGRAGTPMPPWGVAGGGALNDQQLDDLIAYLQSIQLDPKDVKKEAVDKYGTDGKALFDAYCARCHTQGYSYGEPTVTGGGAYGPDLTGGATLRQFPAVKQQIEWVTQTVPIGKQYGQRGISSGRMPHFENMLTNDQIQAIVDYERTL